MSLAAGQTLTHFEILGLLGTGAMGEVYRARDTRLGREVAIKVLPDELAADAERLRRFEREARTLASLSHAHIAQVYGIDQVGDTCFIAMELVPGEDLATRLARGPLPVDEVLDVCRQIAEGLEAAHEAGIVHRDLKPANVRITDEGVVKLLDFGLAKPVGPAAPGGGTSTSATDSVLVTEAGRVLGTPTYMSPEQARGKAADRRVDIWALGCVLYECLTGRLAFAAESVTDVLAAIVGGEPDWSRLPPLPRRVTELLHRMLTKDARLRLRDAGEARVQLSLARDEPVVADAEARGRSASGGAVRTTAFVMLGSLAALAAGVWIGHRAPADPAHPVTAARIPVHAILHEFGEGDEPDQITISPDGTRVAWSDDDGLHVRRLDDPEPQSILAEDTDAFGHHFAWSPDSREIAYIDGKALWRIPAEGGPARRIADLDAWFASDLQWLDDGRIAYVADEGVVAVSDEGDLTVLAEMDRTEIDHLHGFVVLPGDLGTLTVPHRAGGEASSTVLLYRPGQGARELFTAESEPGFVASGPDGSLYWHEWQRGRLWESRLSAEDATVRGEPRLVAERCDAPSLSADGTLVYVDRVAEPTQELGFIDRTDGSFTPFGQQHASIWGGELSADGRQVVFATFEDNLSKTWVHDVDRGVSQVRIQRDDGSAVAGFFPDGRIGVTPLTTKRGTYVYPPSGKGDPVHMEDWIWWMAPDGSLTVSSSWGFPGETTLSISGPGVEGGRRVLFDGAHGEILEAISRDWEWMLYSSEGTGRREIFLTRWPPAAGQEEWQVSAVGGDEAWFGDRTDEILVLSGHEVQRVTLAVEPGVRLGAPEPLFELPANLELLDFDGSGRFLARRFVKPGKTTLYVDTTGSAR